jgi:4-hydroxy-tetrahydrodipicolinate synthase
MKKFKMNGVIPAMATPFTPEENFDPKAIRPLVKYLLDAGVHGIFTVSGAGEFSSLDIEEKKELIEITVNEVNKKVPVIAGAGAVSTREAIKLTQASEEKGADCVCVIAPYTVSPSQNELYHHFSAIAENTSLPVIVYNHPPKTGLNLLPDLIGRLAKIENIIGIKDSSNNLSMTMEYIKFQNDNFSVFAGIDSLIYASLIYGAHGTISSSASVLPGLVVKIYDSFMSGNYRDAINAQNVLFSFRKLYSIGTFPSVIKEALNMMGIPVGPPRGPVKPLNEECRTVLRSVLKDIGAI